MGFYVVKADRFWSLASRSCMREARAVGGQVKTHTHRALRERRGYVCVVEKLENKATQINYNYSV